MVTSASHQRAYGRRRGCCRRRRGDLVLLLFRFAIGAVMLAHGLNHVFGGGRIAGTARWFESLGMRPGLVHAWLASLTEIGAGILLLLGLAMPLAGAGVVGTLGVAWITNHRGNGFFIFRPGEGWEYVMVLTVTGLVLGTIGGGEWSLDHLLDLDDDYIGLPGLVVTLVAGGGGAAVLLATSWRPSRR